LLIALVWYLIRQLIIDNKAELKEVAKKAQEIEHNYLTRFEDIKEIAERNHREVLFLIEGINIKLATITEQVTAQKQVCETVQRSKQKQ
jgi:aminoglycoside N3'-acetyltransferase